ncbi:MAG: ParB/RepB/Spo0J family partition protein [Maricaulaceae bacterium]
MSDDKKNKNKKTANRGLGRGLSALMADMSVTVESQPNDVNIESDVAVKSADINEPIERAMSPAIQTLLIDKLVRNPDQPRRHFDPRKLAELTESIRLKGVLQPLLVRPILDTKDRTKTVYQIVAGERRWQASLKAGLARLPVLVRELSDQDVLEIGVVENVQRADLNPIEEALAYKALTEQFSRTQDEIAKAIGKSRPHITNMLRLLTLPKLAQEMVQAGKISMGHARAIIAADDPTRLAQLISDKNLSVREAEKLVRQMREPKTSRGETKIKSADIRAVETELMEALGLKIDLRHKGPKGELRIFYSDDGQLDDIVRRLKSKT